MFHSYYAKLIDVKNGVVCRLQMLLDDQHRFKILGFGFDIEIWFEKYFPVRCQDYEDLM